MMRVSERLSHGKSDMEYPGKNSSQHPIQEVPAMDTSSLQDSKTRAYGTAPTLADRKLSEAEKADKIGFPRTSLVSSCTLVA